MSRDWNRRVSISRQMSRVLLVAFDERERSAWELSLALRGYEVVSARSADAALALARDTAFSLIIIGQAYSHAAKLELCRALRTQLPSWATTILVVAQADQPARIVAAIDAGASNFIGVPLDVEQLRGRLDEADRRAAALSVPTTNRSEQHESPRLFQALVEHALDGMALVAPGDRVGFANSAMATLLKRPARALVGLDMLQLFHRDDAVAVRELLGSVHRGERIVLPTEARVLRGDGSIVPVAVRAVGLADDGGSSDIALYLRDIAERKRVESELKQRAFYDPLTALPNRSLFLDFLEHSLARANRRGEAIAVLLLELDNVKHVNDTHGHALGDQLLTHIAERLRACLRSSDIVARTGSDEFTVAMEDVDTEETAIHIAERIVLEVAAPYTIAGAELSASVRVGVSVSTPGVSRAVDLLHEAAAALYRVKAEGESRWTLTRDATTPSHAMDQAVPAAPRPVEPHAIATAHKCPRLDVRQLGDVGEPETPDVSTTHRLTDLGTLLDRISALEREIGRIEFQPEG